MFEWVETARADEPVEASSADDVYLQALSAWQTGHTADALRLAVEAAHDDPDQEPARLLAGYALLRVRAPTAGAAVLRSLALTPTDDPVDGRVRSAASVAIHRIEDRTTRQQLSISWLQVVGAEKIWSQWTASGEEALVVDVPTGGPRLRLDLSHRYATGLQDVGGWRVAPMALATWTHGHNAIYLGLGPSLWIARGVWWDSGVHPYFGARAAAGTDVRVSRRWGFSAEIGATPHLTDRTLSWYAHPFDIRAGVEFWPGRPRS